MSELSRICALCEKSTIPSENDWWCGVCMPCRNAGDVHERLTHKLGLSDPQAVIDWMHAQEEAYAPLRAAHELSKKMGECVGYGECGDCFDRDGTRTPCGEAGFVRPALWLCPACAAARPPERSVAAEKKAYEQSIQRAIARGERPVWVNPQGQLEPLETPYSLPPLADDEYNDANDPPPNGADAWAAAQAARQAEQDAWNAQQEEARRQWQEQQRQAEEAHEAALQAREDSVNALASAKAKQLCDLAVALRDEFKLDNDNAVTIARETLAAAEAEIPPVGVEGKQYEMDVNSRRITRVGQPALPVLLNQRAAPTDTLNTHPAAPQTQGGPLIDPLGPSFGDSLIARALTIPRGI